MLIGYYSETLQESTNIKLERVYMSNFYNIAVIAGDGTGPEVIREGRKVLDTVAPKFDFSLNYVDYDLGGERYLR